MQSQKRICMFTVDAEVENGIVKKYKNVEINIEVTQPNENGIFSIIIQIGNETPTIRLSSIYNKKIVKTLV